MSTNETLLLRWNEFEVNVKQGFSQLRSDEDFYDVTLSCGGGNQIKAHKVILATYSPFFKSLLKALPHQHPLIYLRGVSFAHLKAVLGFMYQGEVRIRQEELDDFLAVAQDLQVNGLVSNSNPPPEEEKKAVLKRENPHESGHPNKKRFKEEPIDLVGSSSSAQSRYEETNDEEEAYEDEESSANEAHEDGSALNKVNEVNEQLDAQINKFISPRNADNKFKCLKCAYTTSKRCNVKSHIEAKHFVTNGFPCDKCGRRYKTRNSLSMHKSVVHKKDLEFFSTDAL